MILSAYLAWVLALAVLAVLTSNPPQINLAQLGQASLIVVARVDDLASGRCRVERSFSPGQPPEDVRVNNLTETSARLGEAYLLPLIRDFAANDGSFRVVDRPDDEVPPLIYPAGPDVEALVEAWQRPRR